MKFPFIIFLIFLTAGSVFSQGKFYFTGEFELGGLLEFARGQQPKGGGGAENVPYYREDSQMHMANVTGKVTLNYDNNNVGNGNFHSELTFFGVLRDQTSTTYLNPLESMGYLNLFASYDTEQFKIAMGLNTMQNSLTSFKDYQDSISYLYGWYYFWNKQIKFHIAYKGYEPEQDLVHNYSYSMDLPLASNIVSEWNMGIPAYDVLLPWWGVFEGVDGMKLTYRPDQSVGFLNGLAVSFMWRDLFSFKQTNVWGLKPGEKYDYTPLEYLETFTLLARYDVDPSVLPLAVSFGYANRGSKGLHLGACYNITDAISVKGDMLFGGIVDINKYGFITFGADPFYAATPWYIDLNFRFGTNISKDPNKAGEGNFQLEPVVKYAIISHLLLAELDPTFTFGTGGNRITSWYLTPGIYLNLNKDADTDVPTCGIKFYYTYGKTLYDSSIINILNDLAISFLWSF